MYSKTTNHITVTVQPFFLNDESEPANSEYIWAYHIAIENQGKSAVQLCKRYWRITDALGRTEEVVGEGVVGEKPIIPPGSVFEYTSGTPLKTPSGIMAGRYLMQNPSGESFEIDIPAFSLDSPFQPHSVH
jgi:ApaG protein